MSPTHFKLVTFFLNLTILLDFTLTSSLRAFPRKGSLPSTCPADLEKKFLSEDGKCDFSGLFPVKGSFTAYIACMKWGDFTKPIKRIECPKAAGLAFDINDSVCRPVIDVNRCLQRICFPEESMMEDGLLDPEKNEHESSLSGETTSINDEDLTITLSLGDEPDNKNDTSLFSNKTADFTSSSSISVDNQLSLTSYVIVYAFFSFIFD